MSHPQYHGGSKPPFDDRNGLATTLALTGTAFVAPTIYRIGEPIVYEQMSASYGPDLAGLGLIGFAVASAAASYFTLKISITLALTALLMGAGKLAMNFQSFPSIGF